MTRTPPLFRGDRFDLDHQVGKYEPLDAEQRLRRSSPRLGDPVRVYVVVLQESVHVGREEAEAEDAFYVTAVTPVGSFGDFALQDLEDARARVGE